MSLGLRTCSEAAYNGHLECLKYAHENGCPWDEDLFEGCLNGHLECLKYARENGVLGMNILVYSCQKWSPGVFEVRARKRVSLG